MALLTVRNVSLKGIASCVPANMEENAGLPLFKEDEAQKFSASTGIFRRRLADKNTTTSDLCYYAAEKLITELGWEKDSIECLVFVTQSPDYILPATSCILQERLGLGIDTYAIDISLGCSGWVYGLATISQMISASGMKRGLLLCGDTTTYTSTMDKSAYPLFGACGTATAFQFEENSAPMFMNLNTDGSGYKAIIIPDGGCRNPVTKDSLEYREIEEGISRNSLQTVLDGMDVFTFGISRAPQSVNKLLEYANVGRENVDYYLFHQANLFMNEKIRKKLKLTAEQVPYSLADFGNTSSASIPLTATTQIRGRLSGGKLKMVACGFGVGLSWGSVYLETNEIVCPDLVEI